ncbi:MAG: hypothetical protein B7Z23_08265 [Pseudomonadales bacterium 32-61-5]|nr:MAG: hypothetical protein B7Z23_08265 [Pseudomonadales bacterium 32-61-5]
MFIPWFWQEEYRRAVPADFALDQEETEYMEAHGLDLEQIRGRLREELSQLRSDMSELMTAAEAKAATGNPEDLPEAMRLMLDAVFNLERMLFENSFVNQLYIGMDKYDRDPYAVVQRDAEDNIVTNQMGEPQRATALQDFRDPETGEVRQGYVRKNWYDAYISGLQENRFMMAAFGELTSLGNADAWRTDKVQKIRTFHRQELTYEEAKDSITYEMADGVVRAMWKGGLKPEELNLEGFYMSSETRQKLSDNIRKEIFDQAKADGLSDYEANRLVKLAWNGSPYIADQVTLEDIVWSKNSFEGTIPKARTVEYAQLNSPYIKGPDGNYWATGLSRNLLETFASLMPLSRYTSDSGTGLSLDSRLNAVDEVLGLNTGMRALEELNETFDVPEMEDFSSGDGTSSSDGNGWVDFGNNGYRSGWRNFGRRRYGGGGGGGGGSFTRLNPPQDSQTPYSNTARDVGSSNPIIRRSSIRRERTDSERGRLKPWQ